MYFDLELLLPGVLLAVVVGAALHVKVGAQIKTTAIVCLLIIGIFGGVSLYSGYDQHNELTMGDYAHEQCDFNGGALIGMCSKTPSVCKVRQGFDGDFYYCKEHLFYAEYLTGKAKYSATACKRGCVFVFGIRFRRLPFGIRTGRVSGGIS